MSKEEILNQYESFKFTNDELDETHYYKDNVLLAMEEYATIVLRAQEEKHKEEMENLKICTGCGRLSSQKISEGFLSCCPDNNYIPIREYWFHSKYINV